MTLEKLFHHSIPQFPHLQNEMVIIVIVPSQWTLTGVKWDVPGKTLSHCLTSAGGRRGVGSPRFLSFTDKILWRTWACTVLGCVSVSACESHIDSLACIGYMAIMWTWLMEGNEMKGNFTHWVILIVSMLWRPFGAFPGVVMILFLEPPFCPGDSHALILLRFDFDKIIGYDLFGHIL